ncbi:MAG: DUF3194 domain-containing protein [archaeon GB-1867-035]|nr:DUF3194 domain-containing protein [Candidatus Culexmicrobium profundum]
MAELVLIGIKGISEDQIVELCELAENTICNYLFSNIPKRQILDLDITVEADLNESLIVTIDIDVTLSPFFQGNLEEVEDGAIDEAFRVIEQRLREFNKFVGERS